MPNGTPVNRHYVVVTNDGRAVIDWGTSLYQDMCTGEFVTCAEPEISHQAQNDELETLKRSGYIETFDEFNVYVHPLPEQGRRTLE
jgi:hypothetical protein